jgi:hypothetical protein
MTNVAAIICVSPPLKAEVLLESHGPLPASCDTPPPPLERQDAFVGVFLY